MTIKHSFGFENSIYPFLWDYENMLKPFRTIKQELVDRNTFITKICDPIAIETIELIKDPIFCIHEQEVDSINGEVYLGYHNWCYFNETNNNKLDKTTRYYTFDTGIFNISGHLVSIDKKSVPIDKLENRSACIHCVKDIPRYSPRNVNCFTVLDKKISFVSIGKDFKRSIKKGKDIKIIEDIAPNIVTLHTLTIN